MESGSSLQTGRRCRTTHRARCVAGPAGARAAGAPPSARNRAAFWPASALGLATPARSLAPAEAPRAGGAWSPAQRERFSGCTAGAPRLPPAARGEAGPRWSEALGLATPPRAAAPSACSMALTASRERLSCSPGPAPPLLCSAGRGRLCDGPAASARAGPVHAAAGWAARGPAGLGTLLRRAGGSGGGACAAPASSAMRCASSDAAAATSGSLRPARRSCPAAASARRAPFRHWAVGGAKLHERRECAPLGKGGMCASPSRCRPQDRGRAEGMHTCVVKWALRVSKLLNTTCCNVRQDVQAAALAALEKDHGLCSAPLCTRLAPACAPARRACAWQGARPRARAACPSAGRAAGAAAARRPARPGRRAAPAAWTSAGPAPQHMRTPGRATQPGRHPTTGCSGRAQSQNRTCSRRAGASSRYVATHIRSTQV